MKKSCEGRLNFAEVFRDEKPTRLVPLSPHIAWHSTTLPGVFHDDPADQIIVATARIENATILTTDTLIRKYEHVQSLW